MPVCINEARPNGKIRYEWTNGNGRGFHLTGEYISLEPYRRTVHVERMHLPDPTPDNHVETRFDPDGTGTLMTMRMTLPNLETRTQMLATGMERGMEAATFDWRASFSHSVWMPHSFGLIPCMGHQTKAPITAARTSHTGHRLGPS